MKNALPILFVLALSSCASHPPDIDPLEIPNARPKCTFKIYQGDSTTQSLRREQDADDSIPATDKRFGKCSCLCEDDFENFLECGGSK